MSARPHALLLAGAAVLAAAPPASAAAPRLQAQVVTKSGRVYGPHTLRAPAASIRSSGHRCRVAQGTGLAVLAALDRAGAPRFRTRGECSALYVFQVGADRERGAGGWVFKVDRRVPSLGAGDPTLRARSGQRVTWFWCKQAASCQRTLEIGGAGRSRGQGHPLAALDRGHVRAQRRLSRLLR